MPPIRKAEDALSQNKITEKERKRRANRTAERVAYENLKKAQKAKISRAMDKLKKGAGWNDNTDQQKEQSQAQVVQDIKNELGNDWYENHEPKEKKKNQYTPAVELADSKDAEANSQGIDSESSSTSDMDDNESDSDLLELPGSLKRKREESKTNESTSSKKTVNPFASMKAIETARIATKARYYNIDLKRLAAVQNTKQVDPEKEDLEVKSYAELKEMFTKPKLRALYGDDLLLATWTANFKRMTLDRLQSMDRDQVPEKSRFLINEVIENKTYEMDLAALNAFDDNTFHG
ncbi:hypothetical protein KCU65_g2632, partial [Aureobasidium melanogenum]